MKVHTLPIPTCCFHSLPYNLPGVLEMLRIIQALFALLLSVLLFALYTTDAFVGVL